ncbi:hypothetical protein Ancab_037915 [Ancistrocladus abbreviatus]
MSTTTTTTTTVSSSPTAPPPPTSPSSPSSPTNTVNQSLSNLGLGYAIAIALGFLVLLSTLILSSYLCYRSQRHNNHRPHPPPPSDGGIILPRIIFVAEEDENDSENRDSSNGVVGLDQSVINSYPKFPYNKKRGEIDNSNKNSDSNSNSMCSICLCDYKEGEMLRMMPDCKHFFHLCCLDAWLRLNGSCPVCRNSPLPTPLSTPLAEIRSWKGIGKPILLLGSIAIVLCIANLFKFYSVRSLFSSDSLYSINSSTNTEAHIRITVETVVRKIQKEIEEIKGFQIKPLTTSSVLRYGAFLGHIMSLLESALQERTEIKGIRHPLSMPEQGSDDLVNFFLVEEIRKYVKIKPNRLKRQNFMGANATFTSIGHACFAMKEELEKYMDYDIGEICNDDWKLAQKLMVHGCDPLPRRRCFSRAPPWYTGPYPLNESMWKLPDDKNVRWSHYRCKSFTCLAANATGKGFFKCADCFNLTHHEMTRWVTPSYITLGSNLTADILIDEVLGMKPGELRIGLDFSIGTGSFAARMREFNVTVVTATVNLGAPFNEVIALRGLVPLYLTINQRLPFFDNTLDLIHTTRFLDGWVDFMLLDFVLYDWDRVLRPGGLLWIDSFFCLKNDLDDYLEAFKQLRYKRHKWIVVPKLDKDDREVFFSAVLEKPPRPF